MRASPLHLLLAACAAVPAQPADRVIESPSNVENVSFSTDGRLLYGLCRDGKLRAWNTESAKLESEVAPHSADSLPPNRIGYSVDAGLVVTSEQKGGVVIRDLAGAGKKSLKARKDAVRNLTISPDGKLLAGVNPDSRESGRYTTVSVWELSSGRERFAVGGGLGGFGAIEFSPDGRVVVGPSSTLTCESGRPERASWCAPSRSFPPRPSPWRSRPTALEWPPPAPTASCT